MTSSAVLPINQEETQMHVDPVTLKQNTPQVLHIFETKAEAKAFRETFSEHLNIIDEAIGWRVGHTLPDNATAYLWPSRTDETGKHWLREIAATTKAALKLPRVVSPHWYTSNWIAYGTEPENLPTVMAESETIDNTDEKTDYDALVKGFQLAQTFRVFGVRTLNELLAGRGNGADSRNANPLVDGLDSFIYCSRLVEQS